MNDSINNPKIEAFKAELTETGNTTKLWAHLTTEQVSEADSNPFIQSLPSQAAKAVALLVFEALRECGQGHSVERVKFENGEFYIPANPNPCGFTEPLKECSQYQQLPEELADLVLWIVD